MSATRDEPGPGPEPAPLRLESSLCFVRPAVADAEAALRMLGEAAVGQGYARPSFVEAVVQREKDYPTGLPLPVPIAIPHAEAGHVLRPGLAALVPPRPLTFHEMGGRERTVEVQMVLMLLVDDPAAQVSLLARLMRALRRPDLDAVLLDGVGSTGELAERFAGLEGPAAG